MSGLESDIVSDSTHFNAIDISALTDPIKNDTKFKGVDILITSQWPKGIEKYGADIVGSLASLFVFCFFFTHDSIMKCY